MFNSIQRLSQWLSFVRNANQTMKSKSYHQLLGLLAFHSPGDSVQSVGHHLQPCPSHLVFYSCSFHTQGNILDLCVSRRHLHPAVAMYDKVTSFKSASCLLGYIALWNPDEKWKWCIPIENASHPFHVLPPLPPCKPFSSDAQILC